MSVRCDAAVVHVLVPEGINDPHRPAGATPTTVACARSSAGQDARCGWSRWRVAGRGRRRSDATRSSRPARAAGRLAGGGGRVARVRAPERDGAGLGPAPVVLLMHMPVGGDAERAVGACRVGGRHPERLVPHLAARARTSLTRTGSTWHGPGSTPRRPPRAAGRRVGCSASGPSTPGKGQDMLLAALVRVADLSWTCTCVGAVTVAPGFVGGAAARRAARRAGGPVHAHRDRGPATSWTRCMPSRTRSSSRAGRRHTGWSSPRRSPAAFPSWRSGSVACPRRYG